MRLLEIILQTLITAILMAVCLTHSAPPPPTTGEKLRFITEADHFDFTTWTIDASWIKLQQNVIGSPDYFSFRNQRQIVFDYLVTVIEIEQIERDLELIYADPSIVDPDHESADERAELTRLVTRQNDLAPLAEATLERQITAILIENDLHLGGQIIPWVLAHITPLPKNLILSRRDKIEQISNILVRPDLTVDEMEKIEVDVDQKLDASSLIEEIGGVGTYPSMILRNPDPIWLISTFAHEWIHNYLELRPLGQNYGTTPELRTMNETTASIVGDEIGLLVIERFYPDIMEFIQPHGAKYFRNEIAFDYNKEMHTTRVRADELLAEGKIEEAEAYMEERRVFFWENGYHIRKLNQAFFAFHGAYADSPGGAAGEDPVGPAVRALRAQSPTLKDFLDRIAQMDSFDDLLEAINSTPQDTP
jgi:hypothetical protein